jgi:hypothetical protein
MNHATTVSATGNRGVQVFPRAALALCLANGGAPSGSCMLKTVIVSRHPGTFAPGGVRAAAATTRLEVMMANEKGPNVKKKQKCKNCEGKGLLKKGDKVVKCQRCGGTGLR